MPEFIIHQHHHYGWTTNTHTADTLEEAVKLDVLKYHEWLPEYGYRFEYDSEAQRYQVYFDGPPYPGSFYHQWSRDGGPWFGDKARQGAADDCPKCGGTGVNHYNPFCQCWACHDFTPCKRKNDPHSRSGVGTGKVRDYA